MAWDCLGVYALVLHSHNTNCNADRAVSLLWVVVLSSTLALLKRFLGFALWFLVRGARISFSIGMLLLTHIALGCFDSISTHRVPVYPQESRKRAYVFLN
jgi:hypothetical protein